MTSTRPRWTAGDVACLRRTNRWTQRDLAKASGYSVKAIAALENGHRAIQRRHEVLFGFLRKFGPLCDD